MTAANTVKRIVVLALLMTAACGRTPAPTRADGTVSDQPWGRTFLATGATENGEPRPLVEGTQVRLDFRSDGSTLGANAGCNSMGGDARIEDGHLVVSDLSTTEMGCDEPRHAQDTWLADFLTGRPSFALAGSDMTLTRDGTEVGLTDREVADPDRPLRGTKWVLDGMVTGDAVASVPDGAEAFVVFSENEPESFGGNTGCNAMGGRAVVGEGSIAFSEIIATKMFCEDGRGETEQFVLEVLDGDVAYGLDADRLTLTHPSGKGLTLRAG